MGQKTKIRRGVQVQVQVEVVQRAGLPTHQFMAVLVEYRHH